MKKLLQISENTSVFVLDIEGEKKIKERLHSLGVLPGKIISVIKNTKSKNPLIVEIDESRFVLSRDFAKYIYVVNLLNGQEFIFDSYHKKTQQRTFILNELEKQKGHFTLEEFTAMVQKTNKTIGNITIYRTLKLLTEKGILETIELPDGTKKFEIKKGHHDHLICNKCGAIIDFNNKELEDLQERIVENMDLELEGHEMKLFTKKCAKCKEAES